MAQWNALATIYDDIDQFGAHLRGLNFVFDSAANLSAVTATQWSPISSPRWLRSSGRIARRRRRSTPGRSPRPRRWAARPSATAPMPAVVDTATNIQFVCGGEIFFVHHIDTIVFQATETLSVATVSQFQRPRRHDAYGRRGCRHARRHREQFELPISTASPQRRAQRQRCGLHPCHRRRDLCRPDGDLASRRHRHGVPVDGSP